MISSVSVMPTAACQPPIARTSPDVDGGFGGALAVAIDDTGQGSEPEVAADESATDAGPSAPARPAASRAGERARTCAARTTKSAREASAPAGDVAVAADDAADPEGAVASQAVATEPDMGAVAVAADVHVDAATVVEIVVPDAAMPTPVEDVIPEGDDSKSGGKSGADRPASPAPASGEIDIAQAVTPSSQETEVAAADAETMEADEAPTGQPFGVRPASPRPHTDRHEHAASPGRLPQPHASAGAATAQPQADAPLPQAVVAAPANPVLVVKVDTAVAQAADAVRNGDNSAATEIPETQPGIVEAAGAGAAAGDTAAQGDRQPEHGERTWQASASDSASSGRAPAATFTLVQSADGTLRLAHVSAQQPPAMASMTPDERAENVTQLIQTMRVMRKDGVSEATVRLRPDHLGEVSIAIRVDGKTVTATIQAESAGVREWLQSQEESIRGSLSQQGLTLEKLQVHRDPKHDRRGQQDEPERQRHRPRRSHEPEPRFEVSA